MLHRLTLIGAAISLRSFAPAAERLVIFMTDGSFPTR